jgi:hypothetical protein
LFIGEWFLLYFLLLLYIAVGGCNSHGRRSTPVSFMPFLDYMEIPVGWIWQCVAISAEASIAKKMMLPGAICFCIPLLSGLGLWPEVLGGDPKLTINSNVNRRPTKTIPAVHGDNAKIFWKKLMDINRYNVL